MTTPTTPTRSPGPAAVPADPAELAAALAAVDRRLERIDRVLEDLSRRLESFDDLKEDMVPMAHQGLQLLYQRMHELEEDGTLAFLRETTGVAHTVATSFTPEDVRALGDNVVSILNTVRNLTQPQMLSVADRAASALQAEPAGRVGLFRAMRDPEVRRGMALLFAVLREVGAVRAPEVTDTAAHAEAAAE